MSYTVCVRMCVHGCVRARVCEWVYTITKYTQHTCDAFHVYKHYIRTYVPTYTHLLLLAALVVAGIVQAIVWKCVPRKEYLGKNIFKTFIFIAL